MRLPSTRRGDHRRDADDAELIAHLEHDARLEHRLQRAECDDRPSRRGPLRRAG